MCKTGKKMDKINFKKFIWFTGKKRIFFLGSFSSSRNEKKKRFWQLNGLLLNWVTIQWKFYHDIAVLGVQFGWGVCHDTVSCIVTGEGLTC